MNVRHIKLSLLGLLLPLAFAACGGSDDIDDNGGGKPEPNVNANVVTTGVNVAGGTAAAITRLEFPKVKGGNSIILVHSGLLNSANEESGINFCTEWDCTKKSQRWTCYQMYKSVAESHTSRYVSDDNQYPQDNLVPASAKISGDAFWRSGYDHGHICPSADRLGSSEANIQTFYLSNMQPQLNSFNAQVWENMESQVRTWFRTSPNDTLYICKGGTIDNFSQILTTTEKGMIVPAYYYMAILQKNKTGYKALGFWVKHEPNSDEDLSKYVVNIATLQQNTGIDFFCNLPDDTENKVESLPVENVRLAWGFRN